tara:strand:- start:777 stop:995 length:219 start_codon:yes stop_codon:yes gene_type:complete
MNKKDVINFAGGFVFGVVVLYVLIQSTLQQCLHVAEKAYSMTVEMENQLIELRSLKDRTPNFPKPKTDERVI